MIVEGEISSCDLGFSFRLQDNTTNWLLFSMNTPIFTIFIIWRRV